MFGLFKKKKESDRKNLADQVVLGINAGNLERYSDAGREMVKALSGYDGVKGQRLQKSLSGIESGKPNLPGQRGYAAEVLDVAERNSEEILKKSKIRYSRVDDLPSHAINETPFDIMAVAPDGSEIISLGSQMKFNQGNPADVADTLLGKKFREKYPHAQYSVPKDRYEAIKNAIADKADSIEKQLVAARRSGNTELTKILEERLDFARRAEKNLVPSKITLAESELAVMNPNGVVTKKVGKLAHDAGMDYAKTAAVISGTMSFARCLNKVVDGEMTVEEVVVEVSSDTAKGSIAAYATGQANTRLAALMRNSSKDAMRKIGESSAPAQIIVFATSLFRIVNDRMEGKITDEECFHSIAKSGIGVIGTFKAGALGEKIGGALGSAGGPVGAIIGSVVAGVVINATYDYAVTTLKAPGIARQERMLIEQQCDQMHLQLEQYRENFRNTYIANTYEMAGIFGDSLQAMALALRMNDADSFVLGANAITRALGGTTQFDTVDEFEDFLDSSNAFIL